MHRRLATAAALAACLGGAEAARAAAYDQQSPGMRALYTGVAVVANVTPFVATLYAPRCLPGYVVCKLTYAGLSLAAAADQLVLSGGGDLAQTRAILHRGFAGDWYLTGRHVAGEVEPQPLPEPPARAPESGGGGGPPPPPPEGISGPTSPTLSSPGRPAPSCSPPLLRASPPRAFFPHPPPL